MEKFFALCKFDDRDGTVYGTMTAEEPDKGGEIFDYDGGGKADVQRWSNECAASTRAAGQEISLGNIRLQHDASKIAGKVVQLNYDDNAKKIGLLSQPASDEIRDLVRQGFVRGYSIAGDYQSRACNECAFDMMGQGNFCPQCDKRVLVRFVPKIVEVSYVDAPCVPSATFEFVRADGSTVLKKFKEESMKDHLHRTAEHHELAAKCHKSLAGHHKALAKVHEARGDSESAKLHKAIGAEHTALAENHEKAARDFQRVGDAYQGQGPSDQNATGDDAVGRKAAKADDFFSVFMYGAPPEVPAKVGLFK